jgi:hypothetical protein
MEVVQTKGFIRQGDYHNSVVILRERRVMEGGRINWRQRLTYVLRMIKQNEKEEEGEHTEIK